MSEKNHSDYLYYMAPMEGVTTEVYRKVYHHHFTGFDRYFTPFLVPHTKKTFSVKEMREILPERNAGMEVIPQILTKNADGFLGTVEKLKEYGYNEVNLNVGCPSKTVVTKMRGAGLLAEPEELDRLLDGIFQKVDIRVSVKTRIGMTDPFEFEDILAIYKKYPISELIVHPRVQKDFYRNRPNLETYAYTSGNCDFSLCYNGDLFCVEDVNAVQKHFPDTEKYMIGRGIVGNPFLLEEVKGIETKEQDRMKRMRAFHEELMERYKEVCKTDKNVLFKMKEIWSYMGGTFTENEKHLKAIRKASSLQSYLEVVNLILS